MRILYLGNDPSLLSVSGLRAVCSDASHEILVSITVGGELWHSLVQYRRRYGFARLASMGCQALALRAKRCTLARFAESRGLECLRVTDVNAADVLEAFRLFAPDLGVMCSFSQILRPHLLSIPRFGVVNLHPSLLPKYRGPYPFYWVLQRGETRTGVTIHQVDAGVDSGDIILQESFDINRGDSKRSLRRKTCEIGPPLLLRAIRLIEEGRATRVPQNEADAEYFSFPLQ